jgi:hypothetical protein
MRKVPRWLVAVAVSAGASVSMADEYVDAGGCKVSMERFSKGNGPTIYRMVKAG